MLRATENKYVRNFLLILAAGLVSAVLGAIFGAIVALLSPEFVSGLFHPETDSIYRYAAAVGMIWGLFIGAGAMGFVIGVAGASHWFKPAKKDESA